MSIETYQIEIDKVDRHSWDHLIMQFDDASISQTWSGGTLGGKRSVSPIIMKVGEEILGCCLISIKQLFFNKLGIATVKWGPLCMKKGGTFNPDVMIHMVHTIKEEYAIKRGYLLRIFPHAIGERKKLMEKILESEGFKLNESERPYRTFLLDLSPTLDDLRNNFLQKWRNCLNKAEKNNLRVVQGTNDDFFRKFLVLAREMIERKDLDQEFNDSFEEPRRIQENLPEPLKMKIFICEADNEPVCASICSAIGNTGIYMLGATGQKGLKLNGSYLLQWHMIQWMKESSFHYYDLGAFNPERNPGVFHFKQGVAGKKCCEETFLGEFYGWFNLSGRMSKVIFDCWTTLPRIIRM